MNEVVAANWLTDEVFAHFDRMAEAVKIMTVDDGYISIKVQDSFTYDIPLRDCETVTGALRWVEHMREKTWMNDEMLSYLIELMCEHNQGK